MTGFPNAFAWRAACAADAVLATWVGPWAVCFAIKSGSDETVFDFVEAQVAADPGTAAFTLAAPQDDMVPVSRTLSAAPPSRHLCDALSAPQSPAEYVEQITWHYGQGRPAGVPIAW